MKTKIDIKLIKIKDTVNVLEKLGKNAEEISEQFKDKTIGLEYTIERLDNIERHLKKITKIKGKDKDLYDKKLDELVRNLTIATIVHKIELRTYAENQKETFPRERSEGFVELVFSTIKCFLQGIVFSVIKILPAILENDQDADALCEILGLI